MNDNINVEEDDAECQLTEFEKEKVRRENRLARIRNSLSKPSLTKSERAKFQRQAHSEQRLLAQSNNNIRMGKPTLQRENEYYSNVLASSLQ
jgi:hypothetical protein